MNKNVDLPSGSAVHSPAHNQFDSVRDNSVYNSIGSSSQYGRSLFHTVSTPSSTAVSKLKLRLQS